MADIQQWRRKIQPTRVRTPAVEDVEDVLAPGTPKQRGLKSKVSSYFDLGPQKATFGQEETTESQLPTWPLDQLYPEPNAEDEMDSIMCRLMSNPYTPLDLRFNACLMRIFEGYRKLKNERDDLQKRLDQEASTCQALLNKYNMAEKDWQDERQDFKEEVKRLEILLSKASKRGLAEVTLARQDSKLRSRRVEDGGEKETLYEFLEKAKLLRPTDSVYDNQRATMRPLLQSPSDKDKRMSQKLAQKKSMTNIHAELPFGTPPRDMRFSLTDASMLEQQALQLSRGRAGTTSTDTSGDTFSTFGVEGGTFQEAGDHSKQPEIAVTSAGDHPETERLPNGVSVRRNIEPRMLMPQLRNITHTPDAGFDNTSITPTAGLGISRVVSRSTVPARVVSESVPVKRQSALSKASGFFNRLRPQLSVDNTNNTRSLSRRFSFEPGDDGAAQTAPAEEAVPGNSEDHSLRKSVSLDALQQTLSATAVGPEEKHNLSPVAASPTPSVPAVEGRTPSRIPTPVYNTGYRAKPRQEREDSASSLITAIKAAEGAGKRSSSVSSSVYSSPSVSREDFAKAAQPSGGDQAAQSALKSQCSSSNRLLDHTNTLRGSNVAVSAARTASIASETTCDAATGQTRPSAHVNRSVYSKGNKQDFRSENARPTDSERDLDSAMS